MVTSSCHHRHFGLTTLQNKGGRGYTNSVEIDAAARLTSRFQLNGSFAYTDATVAEFPNGPCYTGQTLAQGCYVDATNSRVQDLRGKPLNNVPKYKFNIGGDGWPPPVLR
jgi:iron complex outermembrane receptor protein